MNFVSSTRPFIGRLPLLAGLLLLVLAIALTTQPQAAPTQITLAPTGTEITQPDGMTLVDISMPNTNVITSPRSYWWDRQALWMRTGNGAMTKLDIPQGYVPVAVTESEYRLPPKPVVFLKDTNGTIRLWEDGTLGGNVLIPDGYTLVAAGEDHAMNVYLYLRDTQGHYVQLAHGTYLPIAIRDGYELAGVAISGTTESVFRFVLRETATGRIYLASQ